MDSFIDLLKNRSEELEEIICQSKKQLSVLPKGKLRIATKRYGPQFYVKTDGEEEVYLTGKQRGLAARLAQRDYSEKVLKQAVRAQRCIKMAIRVCLENPIVAIWTGMHPARRALVEPFEVADEEFVERWSNESYEPKKFDENDISYTTERGERVRSKSEKIIADMLFARGVPYYYEFPLHLPGRGDIYPDFRVLNVRLRREFRLEHFGMMDNPEYAASFLRKMRSYEQSGYFPGDNLLFTMETSREPLRPETVNELIHRFLL